MTEVIFVTGNENKVKEAQNILGDRIKVIHEKFDLEEIQAIQGKDVVSKKVIEAYKHFNKPILIEDTSLYFDAWNDLPGALVKWFLDSAGTDGICKMLKDESNRRARAVCLLAYYDGNRIQYAEGEILGKITTEPRGSLGFGWDPIFQPEGSEKTFGEMEMDEKNKFSMRRIAFEKLKGLLAS